MYVGQPFEEIIYSLPEVIHKDADNTPKNAKTPQKTCGVTTSLALGANERPSWLPNVDTSRVSQYQWCQLVIKMTIRRGKGGFVQFG